MKNNKGITIVEVIISIVLIAIVLIFLFSVFFTVRREDEQGKTIANLLINQALIIKEIEMDFIEYELIGIDSCSALEIEKVAKDTSLHLSGGLGNCLKLLFNSHKTEYSEGYLMHYGYNYASNTRLEAIAYKRVNPNMNYLATKKIAREVKQIATDSEMNIELGVVSRNQSTTGGITVSAIVIDLPIIYDDEDYGIHLSYTTTNPNFIYISTGIDSYNFKRN